jgi:hypothetical protein
MMKHQTTPTQTTQVDTMGPTKNPYSIQKLLDFRKQIFPYINDPGTKIKFILATRNLGKELKEIQSLS